jgi:uncharacterized protein
MTMVKALGGSAWAMVMAAALAVAPAAATGGSAGPGTDAPWVVPTVSVTVSTARGPRLFKAEVAATAKQQERGLMFRTDLAADGGMLFAPYPGNGGPPKVASFWMKNTPSALDILFIRPDRTIAAIAANVAPFSETPVSSGEPVSAVLEIAGGQAAAQGIAVGDRVSWTR